MLDQVLLDVGLQVGLVGVVPLEDVEDREAGPEPQGGGHLAELQVEVDDAGPLSRVLGEEVRQVGGVEGLPATAGGGGGREHRSHCGAVAVGGDERGRLGDHPLVAELQRPLDALGENLVLHRQLEQVEGARADDVPKLGLGPAVERQQHGHGRQLVVDHLEAGQPRAGSEAGPGDQHVEGTFAGQDVSDRTHPGAEGHLGPRTQRVGHAPDLFGEGLGPVENEDLRVSHHEAVLKASLAPTPGVWTFGAPVLGSSEK